MPIRTVTVFHNIATDFEGRSIAMMDGYQPGHPLVPVFQYKTMSNDIGPKADAGEAFHVFNVGDDPDFGTPNERAVAYRARKNRSLSVGDVVHVEGTGATTWLACQSHGWGEVAAPRYLARNASAYGTTAMDREHVLRTPADAGQNGKDHTTVLIVVPTEDADQFQSNIGDAVIVEGGLFIGSVPGITQDALNAGATSISE